MPPANSPVPHDIRDALRSLARARGFTLVALLTLALGIGATTTLFSVVYPALAAMLLATAAMACHLPARRAMRVDPAAALRAQ